MREGGVFLETVLDRTTFVDWEENSVGDLEFGFEVIRQLVLFYSISRS